MATTAHESSSSSGFYIMAWVSFVIALGGTVAGMLLLEASLAAKGFFAMSYLFTVSSCFTVAKVVRDRHEAQSLIKKIEQAKTEQLLSKYVEPGRD